MMLGEVGSGWLSFGVIGWVNCGFIFFKNTHTLNWDKLYVEVLLTILKTFTAKIQHTGWVHMSAMPWLVLGNTQWICCIYYCITVDKIYKSVMVIIIINNSMIFNALHISMIAIVVLVVVYLWLFSLFPLSNYTNCNENDSHD